MKSDRTEHLSKRNLWNELIALRDEQRRQRVGALQVVKGSELPVENNPLGLIQWYMHPAITDTALTTNVFYRQKIPPKSRSGMLRSQGGQVMYIIEGNGRTMIDGVAHPWEAGDVLNLPLRRDGINVQHINDDEYTTARFVVTEVNLAACVGVDKGSGFELIEPSPDFKPER